MLYGMNVDKETVKRLNDFRDEQLGSSSSKLPLTINNNNNNSSYNNNSSNNSSYINNINVNYNKFSFCSTNCSIVFSHLNELCRSNATGLDNISAKIVRGCADLISVSLCALFNKSLVCGIFPDDWKCARVTPLFKEGEPSDLNNYRPISVISVIAKVFERIVYDQLTV